MHNATRRIRQIIALVLDKGYLAPDHAVAVAGKLLETCPLPDAFTLLGDTDPEQSLPTSGYLNVFFDARSPDLPAQLCEPGRFLVSHVDAPLVEERPTPAEAVQYPAVVVEPVEQLSVPHPREPELAELVDRYRNKLQRAHDDYLEAVGVPRHRLFGWPDLVGEPIRPHLPKLRGRTSWRLLGQFDSDDELEWSWGNMGRLYVFVPGSDLRRGRLDRCRVVLQSY